MHMWQKLCSSVFARFFILASVLFSNQAVAKLSLDPARLEHLNFYLMTVDPGPSLDSRFGHTILRFLDTQTGEDHLLNWGTFSFDDPDFYSNFLKGKLRYWLSDESYDDFLYQYGYVYKRKVVQDKLTLTNQQKSRLLTILADNLSGENRHFWYDFFYYNCSTIPRDYLDVILDGKIKQRFATVPASQGLRAYVRDNLNDPPIVGFGLDIILNEALDHPVNEWQEMFYPPKLREYLTQLPAYGDDGKEIAGQKFFAASEVLVEGQSYPSSRLHLFPIFSAIGAFLCLLILASKYKGYEYLSRVWLAIYAISWGGMSCFLSVFMLAGWIISDHKILHHNANLFVLWPLDFLYMIFGLLLLFSVKGLRQSFFVRFMGWYAKVHLVVFAIFAVCFALGVFQQNVEQTVYYLLPLTGIMTAFIGGGIRSSTTLPKK
jgi:hypothetical protein